LTLARNTQKEFLIVQSSRSYTTYRRPSLDGFWWLLCLHHQHWC